VKSGAAIEIFVKTAWKIKLALYRAHIAEDNTAQSSSTNTGTKKVLRK